MPTVREITDDILAREGGYVNDPADPGGATNFGITIGTMRRLGLDLDGDGQVTSADVRRLTRAQAADILMRHYYEQPRIAELPESVRASVYDAYVNSGANAVRILQRLLNDMRIECEVDGAIGPQTIAAAARAQEAAPDHFADAYGIARRNWYYALADRRPPLRKFARRRDGGKGGWIDRAEEFIAPRYHLTDAEHRARTAAWA
ncbi:holin-associated N-acetylmuramidase [Wenxinia marina]|uniref:Putative secretion activating protein n=1 Tax=Wenxinia marina DSM 24838 TaxID=1123501 RepID=A0A0D0Q309_9RHOB|nr:holin-associated N-acetylmuramidase [Wenxinia marina]KIQ68939.1 Putative secretion activating protein [Wenxinia marina DSM 24838]GGL63947.1 hypothetical protein GCM10011392_18320 [Wenxinia marina]